MTSGEYLKQLEKYLRKLPQSDYEDAMEYFTEYFADAAPSISLRPSPSLWMTWISLSGNTSSMTAGWW